MTRSALVGLIHDKAMKSPGIAYDDGEATTLMSTDADSLEGTGEMFHEIWAQVIEVIVGITLLASQVGWIWPLPLFLIYCKYVSKVLSIHTNTIIYSMLIRKSICCQELAASPEGLEYCNTESNNCYKHHAKRNENCQNARVPRQPYPSYPRASTRGALGSLEAQVGYGVL